MKIKQTLQTVALSALVFAGASPTVQAGPEPFIGEITWFAGNFAPRGWALCDGQLLPINQNEALFSILGTTYGGDGRSTFALPDVRGRVMIHEGNGPGLPSYRLGALGGSETETLTVNQIPSHTHALRASGGVATSSAPGGNVLASPSRTRLYDSGAANVDMSASSITPVGGSQSHNNMQPYNVLNCIIAVQGIFPPRS